MKKYKLIKEYPCDIELGTIVRKHEPNDRYFLPNSGNWVPSKFVENFPEFWQEIKEPLFVTEDGFEVNEYGMSIFVLSKSMLTINCRMFDGKMNDDQLLFMRYENAKKWIYNNELMFSRKQVLDAMLKIYPECTYAYQVKERFLKELGL